MRIGLDCRLWNETGVGRYTRNLVAELLEIDAKNEYVLFVLAKDRQEIERETKGRCVIVIADIRWHSLREQLLLPKILLSRRLDLVHFPYFSAPLFYPKAFVVTIHDLIISHFPTGQASTLPYLLYLYKRVMYKMVVMLIARRARAILTVSEATKTDIIRTLRISPRKIFVTYEGVDRYLLGNTKSGSVDLKNKYFLYVGNAYPHKNLQRLFYAFVLFRETHPSFILAVVGKQDFFYERMKQAAPEGVVFLSVKNDTELKGLYQHATGLVMPSLMEGFGLPPLEAMANACPVLVSDIPSLHEVCGDTAYYFNPYRSEEIAKAMEDITALSEAKRDAITKRGKQHAMQFSWKKMAKETVKIYSS